MKDVNFLDMWAEFIKLDIDGETTEQHLNKALREQERIRKYKEGIIDE